VPTGGATGQVLTKTSGTDYATAWQTPTGGSGGYDDWQNLRAILTMLTAQLSATRMGFADGWIDSIADTSGLTLANCVGAFPAGSATGTTAGIASPTMTSNTAPSGTASASGVLSSAFAAWKAFNRTNTDSQDCWLDTGACLPGSSGTWKWLQYQFTSAQRIGEYTIISRNNTGDATSPKQFVLQGSSDGSSWTDLDTRSVTWNTNGNQSQTFAIASPGSYAYYRLLIKETSSSSSPYTSVAELQLRTIAEPLIMESAAVTTPSGATNYLVEMSVSSGATMTVEVDTGDGTGWHAVTMTRTAVSATVDQLSGTLSRSGTSTKVKAVADTGARVVYGWSLFWK
jgi:hypothetical protein